MRTLIGVDPGSYAYDPAYRVTQSQPTEVAPPPVFTQSTEGFTYDAVGNRQTGPSNPREAASFTYQYDYEHRLARAVKVSSAGTDTITFKYDPFGRRIEKSVATTEDGLPTTYKYTYVYDNEDIILEALERTQDGATSTATTLYVHGPGIDEPLSLTREGQTYYYHADGLGSVTAMTDANGAVVNRYAYDTFGRIQRAEAVRNAYAFTGREYDSETGLYYLRARYYDPEAGRFVSKDPIGFAGGDVNLYGYVGNNPANWIDPLGLARSDWWDPRTYAPDLAGARRIANEVQREARQLSQLPPDIHGPTLPSLHNGSADAWRHARWNERMVNEIGWVTAVIAGYGHELENIYEQWQRGGNSQWDEMWMDLHNNREGRSGRSAWDLLNKRRLRTIKPICRGRGGAY